MAFGWTWFALSSDELSLPLHQYKAKCALFPIASVQRSDIGQLGMCVTGRKSWFKSPFKALREREDRCILKNELFEWDIHWKKYFSEKFTTNVQLINSDLKISNKQHNIVNNMHSVKLLWPETMRSIRNCERWSVWNYINFFREYSQEVKALPPV